MTREPWLLFPVVTPICCLICLQFCSRKPKQNQQISCLIDCRPGNSSKGTIVGLSRHAIAFGWLHEQLEELLTHPTAAPATSLPREQLQELFRLAESLQPQMDALCSLCNMVGCMPGASPPLEAEVRDVFVGCGGWGWGGGRGRGYQAWGGFTCSWRRSSRAPQQH